MDEELKRNAYLEGMKLMKAGYGAEVICARLDKEGILIAAWPNHSAHWPDRQRRSVRYSFQK